MGVVRAGQGQERGGGSERGRSMKHRRVSFRRLEEAKASQTREAEGGERETEREARGREGRGLGKRGLEGNPALESCLSAVERSDRAELAALSSYRIAALTRRRWSNEERRASDARLRVQ